MTLSVPKLRADLSPDSKMYLILLSTINKSHESVVITVMGLSFSVVVLLVFNPAGDGRDFPRPAPCAGEFLFRLLAHLFSRDEFFHMTTSFHTNIIPYFRPIIKFRT